MKHPLSDVPRATVFHLLHHYAPTLDVQAAVSFEDQSSFSGYIAIAERLMNVFHLMEEHERHHIPDERRPNAGVWEMVKHEFHGEFYRIMAARDAPALAIYLSNAMRTSFSYGLGAGTGVYRAMESEGEGRTANLILLADRLAAVAEAVGALPVENPEQGRYGESLQIPIPELVRIIQAHLGVEIFRPQVAGLFGVKIGPNQMIDMRVPDDAYCAYRLKTLRDNLGIGSICEIGAGFGGLAFQAIRHGFSGYTIVDLPSINILQGFFLMAVFGGDAVAMFGEDAPGRLFNILPYWEFFNPDRKFNLVVNRDGLPEMPEERAQEYLNGISARRCVLLSINQEAQAPAGSVDANQLVVNRMMLSVPGMRLVSRYPYWIRKGYVEEIFSPSET